LVRSSLASSIVGFIKGGKEGSLPDCKASAGTSIVFVYMTHGTRARVSAIGVPKCGRQTASEAYLAILELEHERRFWPVNVLGDKLRRYPAFGSVWLPRSCANIVGRCHEGEAAGGARAADGARATGGVFEDWGEGGLLTMASVGSNASTGVANSPSRLVLCRRIGCGVGRVSGLDADSAKGGQASGTNDRRGRGSSSSPSRQPGWGRRTWRLLWLKMDKMASGKARGRPRTFPQKKKDVGQARGWPTLDARAWGASEQ